MFPRNPTLLEKMLLALGGTLVLLDLPMEYLTLYIDMPWINLFNDIKQVEFCEIMSYEESKNKYLHFQIFPIDLEIENCYLIYNSSYVRMLVILDLYEKNQTKTAKF